jgi:hypothetical protein
MNRRANRHFLALTGLVTAFSTVSGMAVAQDESFARKALSTIGIIAPEQAPIDYKERAPLVVPPKFALPPPQERVAGRGGAWPTDPNLRPETPEQIAEEKAEIEARGAGEDGTHVPTVSRRKRGGAASPNSGLAGIVSEASAGMSKKDSGRRRVTGDGLDGTHISADQEIDPDKDKPKLATGPEPERRGLTEPPRGYREPPKVNGVVVEAQPEAKNPFWDPLGLFAKKN